MLTYYRRGGGDAGSERGRCGYGLRVQPVRRVGAAGLMGQGTIVAEIPGLRRCRRRAAPARRRRAHTSGYPAEAGTRSARADAQRRPEGHTGVLAVQMPTPRALPSPVPSPATPLSTSGRPRAPAVRILGVSVGSGRRPERLRFISVRGRILYSLPQ